MEKQVAGPETSTATSAHMLGRVSAILTCLASATELTPAEVAEATNEPRSSVYRLLGNLRSIGFVEPGVRRGSYRLGLRLFSLGNAVAARFDETSAALPVMTRLQVATEQTIYLCVRQGYEGLCVARLDGRLVQFLHMRIGGLLPLHTGAAQRTLLAYQDRAFWAEYVDAFPSLTVHASDKATTAADLPDLLEGIRLAGYAVSDGDTAEGIAAVGAPIFDHSGSIRASLSISGLRPAILGDHLDTNRDLIIEAAREISTTLGYDSADSTPIFPI